MNPFLSAKTVTIRRKYVLEDGYAQLDPLGPGLKAIVRIQFVNELGEDEAGVDGGGLFKDFLESLAATAFDTQYGFFRANPENKLYPNPNSSSVSQDHLNFFQVLRQDDRQGGVRGHSRGRAVRRVLPKEDQGKAERF